MFLLESKENIGKYLKKLIKERGFEKDADFSRAYLKEKYRNIDYTEDDLNEQLKTTKSTFSQIFSGNKGICKKSSKTYNFPPENIQAVRHKVYKANA